MFLQSFRVATLSAMLVGCVWCGQASAAFGQQAASHVHEITIRNLAFGDETTVKVGNTVVWKNMDIFPHTVTASDGSFDSGTIDPGKTWKLIAKKAGKFPYICILHPNMHGTLIVQ